MADSSDTHAGFARDSAVVAHNVAGLHASADLDSELVSQVISGAEVIILDEASGMALIEGEDRYRGWIRRKFLIAGIDHSDSPKTTIAALIADLHSSPMSTSQIVSKLCVSTSVVLGRHESKRDFVPILLPAGAAAFTHRANLSSTYEVGVGEQSDLPARPGAAAAPNRQAIIEHIAQLAVAAALRLVGTPYLWGGTTPFGIDCSGLTQLAYKIAGVQLLRDASLQVADRRFSQVCVGTPMSDALFEPGDLLFFRGSFNHVGLAIGDGSFVHAAGREMGTMVTACDDGGWGDIYIGARRLLPDAELAIDCA